MTASLTRALHATAQSRTGFVDLGATMAGMAEIEQRPGVCQGCHGPLPAPARYGPRRKFCSRKCADAATRTRPGRPVPARWEDDELLAWIATPDDPAQA